VFAYVANILTIPITKKTRLLKTFQSFEVPFSTRPNLPVPESPVLQNRKSIKENSPQKGSFSLYFIH